MRRKELILGLLGIYDDYILGGDINEEIAEGLLSMDIWYDLNVPLEEEILWHCGTMTFMSLQEADAYQRGMEWMKEEIIKRNKHEKQKERYEKFIRTRL